MSDKPLSIWSIKPKKKNVGSPISPPNDTSNKSNPRKRGYDSLIKAEKNGYDEERIKIEDSEEEDSELQSMFGIGKEAQEIQDDIKKLIDRRDKRARIKATKTEDDLNNTLPKPKPRIRPAPALKSTLTRSETIALSTSAETILSVMKRFSQNNQTRLDIDRLRDCVQKLPYIPADSIMVQSKGALSALTDLARNGGKIRVPQDIILDAQSLRTRWLRSDFDKALMRGIASSSAVSRDQQRGKTKRTGGWRFEENYPHKVNALVAGHNGLTVGEWWPLQICAMRDGAHGETEAGISGNKELGCISVVMSNGYSKDEDHGDTILYCGTLGTPVKGTGTSVPSAGTKLVQMSMHSGNPVRLLRSCKSKNKSAFAPSAGIRYDGLYVVTAYEVLDEATQMYRFTMSRQPNQPAIRYEGVGVKPNTYDLKEWNGIKDMMKGER